MKLHFISLLHSRKYKNYISLCPYKLFYKNAKYTLSPILHNTDDIKRFSRIKVCILLSSYVVQIVFISIKYSFL